MSVRELETEELVLTCQTRLEAIEGLDSTEDIANFLSQIGVTGMPGRDTECALAQYLDPRGRVSVRWSRAYLCTPGEHCLRLNATLARFVTEFDRGRFPELYA